MASSKEYLEFIMEQLSELDDVSYRAMMSEYIIYFRGKVIGGIYDPDYSAILTGKVAETIIIGR